MAFAAVRLMWRFIRSAFDTSLPSALKRIRRLMRRQIVLAASDLHFFVALIVYYGSIAALCFFVPLLLSALSVPFLPRFVPAVAVALSIFAIYAVTFTLWLIFIALKVVRFRFRKRRRRIRLHRFQENAKA